MLIHSYLARRFFIWFVGVSLALSACALLLDWVSLASRLPNATATQTLWAAALSSIGTYYKVLPLVMLLAAAGLFISLSRSSESTAARAAGLSALKLMIGPILCTSVIAFASLAVMNPIVAGAGKAYIRVLDQFSPSQSQTVQVALGQIWLRQSSPEGQIVINGTNRNASGTELSHVQFFTLSTDGQAIGRADAASAILLDGAWVLRNAKIWDLTSDNPERDATTRDELHITSDLTEASIINSFGAPSTIPIWELPAFIQTLQDAGFSAQRHRAWFAGEVARPLYLVAMMLVGAGFLLRHFRSGSAGLLALGAVVSGFGLYFLRQIALSLGQNGQLPVWLAAAVPALAAFLLAMAIIFQREES